MERQEIKIGDRVNTPKGEGKVINVVDDSLLVELADDEWWFCPHYLPPKQRSTAEDNFDDKVRLGGALARLKEKREELVKIKEKDPSIILFNARLLLNELSPLVYPDKETWGAISASCDNIIDVYIGAINRDFEKVKAKFEKL